MSKKWYKTTGKKYNVRYIDYQTIDYIKTVEETIKKNIFSDKKIRILIGNNATETNRHKEVFKLLSKFEDSDFEVHVPLSYGDEAYKEEVLISGKELLKDKFLPITSYMKKTDYFNFLSEMDIAFFNNNRQQALGNIRILMYFSTKIYMNKNSSMYKDMHGKYVLYDINDVKQQSFDDLVKIENKSLENNKVEVSEFFTIEVAVEEWKTLFYC
ncbi:TDP-N-acetylfucosamine:lipid II N-acetylfucosaminyltransferase [Enterococcus sp.]|uniref:TDP-N-acetylfucosamine:lipid II N-acetylfucosaminyltransferase n=1 Tax=Enterococcus sp. TaxID=35783 RepID=UPI003995E845